MPISYCDTSPMDFRLGDLIQSMQYSVGYFENVVDLVLYRYCCRKIIKHNVDMFVGGNSSHHYRWRDNGTLTLFL